MGKRGTARRDWAQIDSKVVEEVNEQVSNSCFVCAVLHIDQRGQPWQAEDAIYSLNQTEEPKSNQMVQDELSFGKNKTND